LASRSPRPLPDPAPDTPIPVYFDELGFMSGPAEISLTAIGIGKPIPVEIEQRLEVLLYGRAKAHKLS
jgi:hypothetical protein